MVRREAMTWVLTTCVKTGPDFYTENILPITGPLFAAYANRWEIAYDPHPVTDEDIAEFVGHIPTRGTEPVYASIPHRRALLDQYEGVLYLDEDAVLLHGDRNICLDVTDEKPIGMIDGLTGAIQVLKSTPKAKEFLDTVWDLRHAFKRLQWAEEGAMKMLMGWDHVYEHNTKGAVFLGDTEWTPYLTLLQWALFHPLDPNIPPGPWLAMNPGGCWPLGRRLEIVREYAGRSSLKGA